jgi:hypothetical protein
VFYTRRIGRTPQLREGPEDPAATAILGAAKLTGRIGRGLSVGLVEAVTRREVGSRGTTIEPQTSYFVGRAYQELRGGRSGVGAMLTAVNRDLDEATVDVLRREAYTALVQGFHRFLNERFELMSYAGYSRVGGSARAIALTQADPVHLFQRPDHEEEYDSTRTGLGGCVASAQIQKLGGNFRFLTNVRYASAGMEINDVGFVTLVNDLSLRNTIDLQATRPRRFYRTASASLDTEQHWTPGGLPTGTSAAVETNVELPNYWAVSLDVEAFDLASTHCVSCARGGPALRLSPGWGSDVSVDGDPRRVFVPHLFARYERRDEGRSVAREVDGSVDLRIASRFSMSIGSNVERRTEDAQWVANYGAILSDTTHYTFARLRQTTVGVTARASFAATPTLSLQLYAEPFVSSGSYVDWRELRDARARAYDDRFRPFGDGRPPDGFNVKQFNSNLVARWEYRPGSTLFLVWQQGRTQDGLDPGTFRLGRDYRNLFREHPDNTFLIKLSYWFNP